MPVEPGDAVTARVRLTLARLDPGVSISSAELAKLCWPQADEVAARAAFFRMLGLASWRERMQDCWTQGAPMTVKRFGKDVTKRPYLWHRPYDPCPHCAGTGWTPRGPSPDDWSV